MPGTKLNCPTSGSCRSHRRRTATSPPRLPVANRSHLRIAQATRRNLSKPKTVASEVVKHTPSMPPPHSRRSIWLAGEASGEVQVDHHQPPASYISPLTGPDSSMLPSYKQIAPKVRSRREHIQTEIHAFSSNSMFKG